MAKKYYWLKLKEDFFSQPRIKKLRKIAGGETYTLIYLKLQLLSLKNDGVLTFEGIEDDFANELSLIIDETPENIQFTLMYLLQQGLIEEVRENQYALLETMENIGNETAGAQRVRKLRESRKALQCNTDVTNCNTLVTNCNTDVQKCNTEIEIEKEIDIEKDIYTPPYPPKGEQGKAKPPLEKKEDYLLTALNDAPLNHDVKEQMRKWLAYKKERKDKKYTQVGFNSLLNQTKKYCDKYGDTAVIECIENSISAGYQGIIWDKIAKGRSAPYGGAKNGANSAKNRDEPEFEFGIVL